MFWLDLCNLWRQPCFQCMQPLPNNIYSTIPSTYIALQTAWCVQWTLQLPVINGSGTFFFPYLLARFALSKSGSCMLASFWRNPVKPSFVFPALLFLNFFDTFQVHAGKNTFDSSYCCETGGPLPGSWVIQKNACYFWNSIATYVISENLIILNSPHLLSVRGLLMVCFSKNLL